MSVQEVHMVCVRLRLEGWQKFLEATMLPSPPATATASLVATMLPLHISALFETLRIRQFSNDNSRSSRDHQLTSSAEG